MNISLTSQPEAALIAALGKRCIVLVGMMGSGKTSVGRRLAARLGLDFADADAEIETAHRMTIPEIFAVHGEPYFRDGERRVIARLLAEGPKVVATGGGAFMNAETRARIAEHGVSIWLKADFDVLMRRVRRRANRPLLQTPDPEGALRKLIDDRYPIYAQADVTVISHDGPHEAVVAETMQNLMSYLNIHTVPQAQIAVPQESTLMNKVRVDLGQRSYDILVGDAIIERAGAEIAKMRPHAACAIVTDSHVAHHHLTAFRQSLDAAGIRHVSVVMPPGEASKSYEQFAHVCDGIIGARMERGDLVVALGGGVVGDLAGFAAASVRRGMDFVQVPTSLLAQVDSSVGGKTGINSPHGKNLVGAFHQPILVLADTACLDTLPPREFKAGYAEVAKYGLIDKPDFFDWLEAHWGQVFAGGPARQEAIRRSCEAKAAVVARDERETGDRALLNLGHTFGHALERLTHYDGTRLVHGEGVAIGMACAFRFSQRLGLCSGQDVTRVEAHLRNVGLPIHIKQIPGWDASAQAMLDAMYQDKKVSHGALTFILAHAIGRSFIATNVAAEDVLAFLSEDMERI